ncbi:hypothetical protein D3C72_2205920 [compost metagenome]
MAGTEVRKRTPGFQITGPEGTLTPASVVNEMSLAVSRKSRTYGTSSMSLRSAA